MAFHLHSLPRILVIDDLLGWSRDQRDQFCRKLGIIDQGTSIEEQQERSNKQNIIARAVFHCGQSVVASNVVNDLARTMDVVSGGWEDSEERWALVLLDLQFDKGPINGSAPDVDRDWPKRSDTEFGFTILAEINRRWPSEEHGRSEIPVVVLSSQNKVHRGKQAGRFGAEAYVEKDSMTAQVLSNLLEEHGLIEDDEKLVVGNSPRVLRTLRLAREIARQSTGNLLILGERGSGKTRLVDYIFAKSPRAGADRHVRDRLHIYTVGAEQSLFKSNLFGHWKGAFTGADKDQEGIAQKAHKGILFLDEIANLSSDLQTELLEFCRPDAEGLRRVRRLGNRDFNSVAKVDVFLVTATNKPIHNSKTRDQLGFLPDLYDRLASDRGRLIQIPRLRECKSDIVPLFKHFLKEATIQINGVWPKEVHPDVCEQLLSRQWHGNIAELIGTARHSASQARNWDELLPAHLLLSVEDTGGTTTFPPPPSASAFEPLINSLRSAEVPHRKSDLLGLLARLENAYANLLVKLLEASLDMTSASAGTENRDEGLEELRPTSAINLLRAKNFKTTEAADRINQMRRLCDVHGIAPTPLVKRAFLWAEKRRKVAAVRAHSSGK